MNRGVREERGGSGVEAGPMDGEEVEPVEGCEAGVEEEEEEVVEVEVEVAMEEVM